MQKNNYLRKTLALVMAFLMIVTMMPVNVFAETYKEKGSSEEKTTDWALKKGREIARYWAIPNQGRIVKVSSAETQKNPSLNYMGTYTRPDGRQVIRLAFCVYPGAVSSVWERLLLKPDNDLEKMIDWKESGMGKGRASQQITYHDTWRLNETFLKFESLSAMQAGSGNVHMMDLSERTGTQTVKTIEIGPRGHEAPIDLVLNAGADIKSLKNNPLIQMRLTDSALEQIYCTTVDGNTQIPYSAYTMSTYIPVRVDLTAGTITTDVVRNYENIFKSGSAYVMYNEKKGYIDVFSKRTSGEVGRFADTGGSFNSTDENNRGIHGFRQSFDSSFKGILKPQTGGVVAQVFIANPDDTLYKKSANDPNVPDRDYRIDITKDQIKDVANADVSYVQVASDEWPSAYKIELSGTTDDPNNVFIPTSAKNLTGFGESTVVRYFIDKQKLQERFGSADIVAYEFFSTLIASNATGVETFIAPTRNEDINLKRGDKITIRFDGRRDLISKGTFDTMGSIIRIGSGQYTLDLRTTGASYKGGGTLSNDYMKLMEFYVPFDIKIKKDEPLAVFSRKTKQMEVSPGMTVTFNSTLDNKTTTMRFERPLTQGCSRDAQGNIYISGKKVIPAQYMFIDNHDPIVRSKQANYGGGILTSTVELPDIDEVFTDSKYISGRTKYDSAKIYLYGRNETDNKPKKLATMTASDKKVDVVVNRKDTKGYEWSSANNNPSDKVDTKIWTYKDTPLFFTNQDVLQNALENKTPVAEQVQAKVHFDLSGQTSKIDGLFSIEKVAPLNKEHTMIYKETEDPSNPRNTIATIEENTNYTPSGFARIDKKSVIEGADNLRLDETKEIVQVDQTLVDNKGNSSTITRNVINYLDHDNQTYDINSTNAKTKKDQVEKLLKRQFPISEEVNLPSNKRIIGWTTVKLEDIKDSTGKVTKTAEEQYYDLLNDKAATGKPKKLITDVKTWQNVDTDAANFKNNPSVKRDVYLFDELSPIDKERTVYAVYGGLSIVLHSGNEDTNHNEITVRLPITEADLDYSKANLDARASATTIIKRMPKAPYTAEAVDVNDKEVDERLKSFVKKEHTFVGWTHLEPDKQGDIIVGRNNERLAELLSGSANGKPILKETEALRHMIDYSSKSTLPNSFSFAFSSKDFTPTGSYTKVAGTGLKTKELLLENVDEIHLYAVYRPYFEVSVTPKYGVIDKTDYNPDNEKFGEYKQGVAAEKQQKINIGLLTRTAVTGYGDPTVDASANYNPLTVLKEDDQGNIIANKIEDDPKKIKDKVLKEWDPESSSKLTWKVPGFDNYGRRKSYVATVVPKKKEVAYANFANPFSEASWKALGISTFVKNEGASLDPNAPRNLYRDPDKYSLRDPYGVALPKIQSFTLVSKKKEATGTVEVTDAFTSATARKPLLKDSNDPLTNVAGFNDGEVTGYDIVMTNALEELPTPDFDLVRNTDTEVKLKWVVGTAQKPSDYDKINKIEFYIGNRLGENEPGKKFTLTKNSNDQFEGDNLKAVIKGDKLVLTGLDLKNEGGKDLGAKYFNVLPNNQETSGSIGTTRIIKDKTSAPVIKMEQGVKEKSTDVPTIKFTAPIKIVDQVDVGDTYIAEKWVPNASDPSTGTWVKVGEKELTLGDKENGKYEGNKYEIPLYNVKDGDKIRIVSVEKNSVAKYKDIEKTADPHLKDGYSRPAYSTGDKDSAPKAKSPSDTSDQYVILDLIGPRPLDDQNKPTDKIVARDEKFRRFINIQQQLDELPLDEDLILEMNTSGNGKGDPNNEKIPFRNKTTLLEYIYELKRNDNMPQMWIYLRDQFGNAGGKDPKGGIEVDYKPSYQLILSISDFKPFRSFVVLKASEDNATINLTVYDKDGNEVATGTATAATKDTSTRVYLISKVGNSEYRLKKGDKIVFTGEATNGNKTYTSNPGHAIVR